MDVNGQGFLARCTRRTRAARAPWAPSRRGALRCGRRAATLGAALVLSAAAGAAHADFRLTNPAAHVYYNHALLAGSEMTLGKGSQVAGNVHSNGTVEIRRGATVTGNVSAVRRIDNEGTVTGTVVSPAPALTLPALASADDLRRLANRVFDRDTRFTNAVVDDVVFVHGDVTIAGSLDGVGTIIATGSIHLAAAEERHPISLAATTRISLISLRDADIGEGRPFRGVVFAGGDVEIAGNVQLSGVVVALHSLSVKAAQVTFLDFDQAAPAISQVTPGDGSFVASARPPLAASFADDFSGVDPTSFRLLVDGADLTAAARATAAGFTATPPTPLPEGAHTLDILVADNAGNQARSTTHFSTDTIAPAVAIASPGNGQFVATPSVQVTGTVADASPIAGVTVNGVAAALTGRSFAATVALSEGPNVISVKATDAAGNTGAATVTVGRDTVAPTLAVSAPAPGTLTNAHAVQVTGTATDAGAGIASVLVNGVQATLAGASFHAFAILADGANRIRIVATDRAGNQAAATVAVTLDARPPTLVVDAPSPGQLVNQPTVHVTGRATDASGIGAVTVNGAPVALALDTFATDVALAEGPNTLAVHAADRAGNAADVTLQVTRFTLPTLTITSPSDLSFIAATAVDVSGTVSDPAARVAVNGVAATVGAGGSFTAAAVPLIEGGNVITAAAINPAGHGSTASINVVRDLTPPHVTIDYPLAGSTLYGSTVTVAGLVNDIVAGTVNASEATVTVNGKQAQVANRSYVAAGIALAPGDNTLTAVATDKSGNVAQTQVVVHQASPTGPHLALVSGDRQQGVIATALAQPLIAAALDAAGNPLAGAKVLFSVQRSNGTLDGGRRTIVVTAGADGRATAHFTLGTRAGAATQVVEASLPGTTLAAVDFVATGLPGPPALIVVDSGDQQVGATGQALPRPLVAAVVDAGNNRLAGVPVRFAVAQGGGQFANGQQQLVVPTDSDGRAIAQFVLSPEEGVANDTVSATIAGLPASPIASFVASGRAAGDPAATSVSGVVLDNTNQPIPGVTVRVLDTTLTAQTDAQGQFRIAGAPIGTVRLLVDGSTASRPGAWPDLEFFLTTIPGRDTTVNMPIYLLPIDLAHGIQVDETHGGTLRVPDIPGFALEIAPGTVTFPSGGKNGMVSVTVVHSDKVPMVPNFGQQPRFIVTIQPPGARFDPPARLTLPNLEGLAAGSVTEFYSFDHDLGHFVSIGPATVSGDGRLVVSNPGVGIVKGGWHCGGQSASSGTTHDCPECTKCVDNNCQPDDSQTCDDKDKCTINDKCQGGKCKGDPVTVDSINGSCVTAVNQPLNLTATSNGADRLEWQAPGGNPAKGDGGSFSVTYTAEGSNVVTVGCKASSKTKQVSVGPDCASIQPQLNEVETAQAPDAGSFGQVHRNGHSAKYKGCATGGKWCFRLDELKEEHGIGQQSNGDTDITGANDPNVDAGHCAAIIADLTPPGPGAGHGPTRDHYYSSTITLAHEHFHVTDFRARVTTPTMNQLAAFVAQGTNCTDCKSDPPEAAFNGKMEEFWNANRPSYFDGNHEVRAHDQSNPMYTILIQQIRARANAAPAAEHWPAACK
jgi:hypothetical protein